MIDTRSLTTPISAFELINKQLADKKNYWEQWENTARSINNYALNVLVVSAIANAAYLGVPVIPFILSMIVNLILISTLRIRIVHENFSYFGAVSLGSYIYSSRSLNLLLKIDALVLGSVLSTIAVSKIGLYCFRNKIKHFHDLQTHLHRFEKDSKALIPNQYCDELESYAT